MPLDSIAMGAMCETTAMEATTWWSRRGRLGVDDDDLECRRGDWWNREEFTGRQPERIRDFFANASHQHSVILDELSFPVVKHLLTDIS